MTSRLILVRALWDDDARVWVASSEDVAGLVTEADTLELLREKILVIIPELLAENGVVSDFAEIPVHIIAEQTARISNPAPPMLAVP